MSSTTKGTLAALVYSLIIGFSLMLAKTALIAGNPIDVIAHRFTAAFIFIFIIALFKNRKEKIFFRWQALKSILPLAIFFPTLFFGFQVFGLTLSTSAEAGIIQATTPIFTLVLASLILKDKTSLTQKLFTLLSVGGVIFIFAMQGSDIGGSHILGLVLIALSCLSFSFYNVFAKKKTKEFSLFYLTYAMTLVAFLIFNGLSLIQHLMNPELMSYFAPLTNLSYLLPIVYLGVVASIFTVYLSNYALSKISPAKMSIFINLSIVIMVFAGAIFLQEKITYIHLIGTIVILIGVIGTNLSKGVNEIKK